MDESVSFVLFMLGVLLGLSFIILVIVRYTAKLSEKKKERVNTAVYVTGIFAFVLLSIVTNQKRE